MVVDLFPFEGTNYFYVPPVLYQRVTRQSMALKLPLNTNFKKLAYILAWHTVFTHCVWCT